MELVTRHPSLVTALSIVHCALCISLATPGAAFAATGVAMRFYRNLFPPSSALLEEFDRDGVAPDMLKTLPDFTLRDPWTLSRKTGISRCCGAILDARFLAPEDGEYQFVVPGGGGCRILLAARGDDAFAPLELADGEVAGMPEFTDRKGKHTEKALVAVPMPLKAGEGVRLRAFVIPRRVFFVGLVKDGALAPIPPEALSPSAPTAVLPRLPPARRMTDIPADFGDDEPDTLCWEAFSEGMPFIAHFLDWAATNPPPQSGLSRGAGASSPASSPASPADYPCLWARLADVPLVADQKSWCNTNFVKGAGCVALKGPPFHYYPGSSAAFDVEVAEEGDYRLWCRFWRPGPKSSGTFNVALSETPSDNPAEDGLGVFTAALEQIFAHTPWHPYRRLDPIPDIRSAPYPADGWMWEASYRLAHLKPGRWRVTFTSGCYPDQPGAVVSDVVLTADPMLDLAAMRETAAGGLPPDLASARTEAGVVCGRLPASAASRHPLFAIRPGTGLAEAPPARLAWWLRWRDALYDKLCDAEYTDYVWGYLASLSHFDEDSNLIGRVREVRAQKGYDAARVGAADGERVGDGDLAFWTQNPFGPFDRFSPPASGGRRNQNGVYDWKALPNEDIDRAEQGVEAKAGEVKSQLLLIRNNTDAAKVVEPILESPLPASVRLVAYTVTADGFWSPQILLKRRQVALPPRQNTALWLSIDCRGAAEGDYPVTLRFAGRAVTWRVQVADSIKDAPTPLTYGWSSPYRRRSCWEAYRDHGLNAIRYAPLSRRVMDEYAIRLLVGIPCDTRNFTEEKIARTVEKAAQRGQKVGDYCWYLIDEPGLASIPRWIEMAETLRKVDERQLVWCNLGESVVRPEDGELYFRMMEYWDVACPFIWQFDRKAFFPEYNERLHTAGKVKLLYHTLDIGATEKILNAPQDILGVAERAIKEGRDGFANYTLSNGTPYDDLYMDNQDNAVSIYPGAWRRTLSTRNFEAWREGVQRWRAARASAVEPLNR